MCRSRTRLELGDYLRSRQIARFFFTRRFRLPESDSAALDPNLDYQDVKLKIVQLEGYDAHDFNLFDDRSSVLWRKPYVDGAVRELTSGDSRSQEQIRQAAEQEVVQGRTWSLPRRAHIFFARAGGRAGRNSGPGSLQAPVQAAGPPA